MKIFPFYPRSNYDRVKTLLKIVKEAKQPTEKQAKKIFNPLNIQKKG